MWWASVFAFKLGVVGTLVLSAFFVWQLTRHMATAPLFFCIKSAVYTFCITFMLTAGNIIMTQVPKVTEPAWYHALPLLVATMAFAAGLFYSSKLALGIGAGIATTASSMAAPIMQMISAARAVGTGGGVGTILSAVAGAGASGGGGSSSGGGGNFQPNRAIQAMQVVKRFRRGSSGGGPVQPTPMPSGGGSGGGIGAPTASQARSIKVGCWPEGAGGVVRKISFKINTGTVKPCRNWPKNAKNLMISTCTTKISQLRNYYPPSGSGKRIK